ncbi:hypothetical protein M501DRAFT_1028701 [Patellaria atrata CBS 101060]|uniref:DNA-directed RNA polymerase III subunit RPC9 n=1 Tax=Patellaria atrata CBS 101060 TaxID=1346257 RepID=A0A9P4VVP9_9PEZI|nr:hypothetical protein M501DRAFT_1028701 [Patellaria atrata CBS 101060]
MRCSTIKFDVAMIHEERTETISNHDALEFINQTIADYNGEGEYGFSNRPMPKNLKKVITNTKSYLKNSSQPTSSLSKMRNAQYRELFQRWRLAKYGARLETIEQLSIVNVAPRTRSALEAIIEEAESRFTNEELDDILEIIIDVCVRGRILGRDEATMEEEAEAREQELQDALEKLELGKKAAQEAAKKKAQPGEVMDDIAWSQTEEDDGMEDVQEHPK